MPGLFQSRFQSRFLSVNKFRKFVRRKEEDDLFRYSECEGYTSMKDSDYLRYLNTHQAGGSHNKGLPLWVQKVKLIALIWRTLCTTWQMWICLKYCIRLRSNTSRHLKSRKFYHWGHGAWWTMYVSMVWWKRWQWNVMSKFRRSLRVLRMDVQAWTRTDVRYCIPNSGSDSLHDLHGSSGALYGTCIWNMAFYAYTL